MSTTCRNCGGPCSPATIMCSTECEDAHHVRRAFAKAAWTCTTCGVGLHAAGVYPKDGDGFVYCSFVCMGRVREYTGKRGEPGE